MKNFERIAIKYDKSFSKFCVKNTQLTSYKLGINLVSLSFDVNKYTVNTSYIEAFTSWLIQLVSMVK